MASAGESVCGGRRPGPYSAGWPGREAEADPAVVEVDAGVRLDQPRAEAGRVRLDQRHAHPVRVGGAQIGGVAGAAGRRAAAGALRVDQARSCLDRRQQGDAVGPFVQHVGTVEPGGRGGFDQEVRPLRVVGVVGKAELARQTAAPPSVR